MPPAGSPSFVSEKEAASYLNVSLSTMRRWRRKKVGPAFYRVGDVLRYSQDALDAFVHRHTEPAA
jgi:excisionase family DNA binding protein